MEHITGYVDHIIFQNSDNGYTVLELVSGETMTTCVGTMLGVTDGMNVELEGEYTEHPSYGTQFKAARFIEKEPEDEMAIERYLGSGAIKGVGAALAARIVRRFGKETFTVIEKEPERLAEIKGISERKAQEIAVQVEEKRSLRSAMLFLQQYGITLTLAVKIYNTYGEEIYSILQKNPYRLADDIDGVGFRIADEIASKVGIRTDSDFRIRSGLLYCLQQAAGEGHTYLPQPLLMQRAGELLGVDAEPLEQNMMNLAMERRLVMERQGEAVYVYAASYYNMEANVAHMLKLLNISMDISEEHVYACIRRIEQETERRLAEHQRQAVASAAKEGVLVITGGPGTGKTTTINTIIRYFEQEGMTILLAAPTGRAA